MKIHRYMIGTSHRSKTRKGNSISYQHACYIIIILIAEHKKNICFARVIFPSIGPYNRKPLWMSVLVAFSTPIKPAASFLTQLIWVTSEDLH